MREVPACPVAPVQPDIVQRVLRFAARLGAVESDAPHRRAVRGEVGVGDVSWHRHDRAAEEVDTSVVRDQRRCRRHAGDGTDRVHDPRAEDTDDPASRVDEHVILVDPLRDEDVVEVRRADPRAVGKACDVHIASQVRPNDGRRDPRPVRGPAVLGDATPARPDVVRQRHLGSGPIEPRQGQRDPVLDVRDSLAVRGPAREVDAAGRARPRERAPQGAVEVRDGELAAGPGRIAAPVREAARARELGEGARRRARRHRGTIHRGLARVAQVRDGQAERGGAGPDHDQRGHGVWQQRPGVPHGAIIPRSWRQVGSAV